ncbi:MAG TPA: TIGR04290 family methyltransferase [Nitrococcus sp.]|nr:TIGR04290 family methyltransferase [Nitrococcus sp.]
MSEASKASDFPGPRTTRRMVEKLAPWFHNLHLPDGTCTAPDHFLGDYPAYKWDELNRALPADLNGWSVLDIGCNAGFYSFELARRGARVTAIDSNPHYLRQARWAAGLFGLAECIEFRCQQLYTLAAEEQTYDLVLFLGVLYHLRYPLLGLDIAARKTHGLLGLLGLLLPGTEVFPDTDGRAFDDREIMRHPAWPKMAFIEGRFADDPTVWWIPNFACLEAMLRSCGLRIVANPGVELYVCAPVSEADGIRAGNEEYAAVVGGVPVADGAPAGSGPTGDES